MRFLYKIHSGYDGFRPSVIPERLEERQLRIGCRHYIDVIEKGWECWVYFHGPHRFENGVYVKGIVNHIDLIKSELILRVREYRTDQPLTSRKTSERVAKAVSSRYRQVFMWPDDWTIAPDCEPKACRMRECSDCRTWNSWPLIGNGESKIPNRLRKSKYEDVLAAHWIIPRRCYESRIVDEVRAITKRFTEFKLGEMAYAYPFALAMFQQLRNRDRLEFDYVVPIPLSPEKVENKEKHRTRELARELGSLLKVNLREMLRLSSSVSKRQMLAQGYTPAQFEHRYRDALEINVPKNARKILLVDDVMTRGSTVAQALNALEEKQPEISVVVATAGQMIVKEAVAVEPGFKAH